MTIMSLEGIKEEWMKSGKYKYWKDPGGV